MTTERPHTRSFAKYAHSFFSGTLLSRISGMIRDMGMAAFFGDHPSVAAFMLAFRFAHFLRRILGEGALQSILIPEYQSLHLQGKEKSAPFFFQTSSLLFALLCLLIVATQITFSTKWGASIFPGPSESLPLFLILFPSLLFVCLYGLNISILQAHNSFFLASAAPLACNLIWIIGIFVTSSLSPERAMFFLALFTTLGFCVQWLLTSIKTFPLLKEGISFFRKKEERSISSYFSLFSPSSEMKTVTKATLFGLIGVAATQLNSFLDMLFAQYADPKGPIYLWYAIRLYQFPLALVGFTCIYSVIPSITKQIKLGAIDEAMKLFSFGKKRAMLFVLASTFALFALALPSVDLLFGRGHFSADAVVKTTTCLLAYGIGLVPTVLVIYYASLLYAFNDYKTASIASFISVGLNIALNALLVFALKQGSLSIALSTSFAAFVNYLLVKRALFKKDSRLQEFSFSLIPFMCAGALAMAITTTFDTLYFGGFSLTSFPESRSFLQQLLFFLSDLTLFTASFTISLFFLHKPLAVEMKEMMLSKRPPIKEQ